MTRRLKWIAGALLAIVGIAAAYAVCALIVLAAAAFTKGASDQPDRGLAATNATEAGWEVTSFNADYRVGADGMLAVTEHIDVDFHFLQKHGIFRNLYWRVDCQPPRIASEAERYSCPTGDLRTYDINIQSVTDATGQAIQYTTPREGDTQQVKIGDPNQLISGKHSYVITYTVKGALDGYSGHDELYWNATGRWPVPITAFSMTVHLPSGAVQQTACFQGTPLKSALCKATTTADGGAAYTSSAALQQLQQATIVATFARGVAAVDAPSIWHEPSFRDFYSLDVIEIGGGVLAAILAAAALAALWWRDGRDRAYRTLYYLTNDPSEGRRPLFGGPPVVVEFTPPDDLRPAQMGVILDERADPLDVTATIIDLAVRGYLNIEELHDPDRDWRLTRLKEGDEALLPYERSLLKAVFNVEDSDTVRLSELKHHFQSQLQAVEERLYRDALQRKWFDEHPETAKTRWVGTGLIVASAGLVMCYGAGFVFERALMLNAIPVAGLALVPLSRAMSRRTATGSEALRRVLGFRLYIDTAETRRQEFNEQVNIFAKYLPYAIVFGSVTKWAKAFSGLDKEVQESLTWYSGGSFANVFATTAFSASLAGLASGMNASISAAPVVVSSGGFSSSGGGFGGGGFGGFGGCFGVGGFSGGGGGGGGGGSW